MLTDYNKQHCREHYYLYHQGVCCDWMVTAVQLWTDSNQF